MDYVTESGCKVQYVNPSEMSAVSRDVRTVYDPGNYSTVSCGHLRLLRVF